MDNFDLKPERTKLSIKSLVWNTLTVVVLLGTCLVAVFLLNIYLDPQTSLNPFPPSALPTLYATMTPTSTLVVIPRAPTWTPTMTFTPVPTRTTAPTWTLLPQMVTQPGSPVSSKTPAASATSGTTTPAPASAAITYVPSTDFHPDLNCNWMGVAGRVLGADGKPVLFMEITLGGTLDGKNINYVILSGNATAYGPSGFEQVLSNHPIASTKTLWIRLFDSTAKPLTDKIYFDTYNTCNQNLVMVVFTTNR